MRNCTIDELMRYFGSFRDAFLSPFSFLLLFCFDDVVVVARLASGRTKTIPYTVLMRAELRR